MEKAVNPDPTGISSRWTDRTNPFLAVQLFSKKVDGTIRKLLDEHKITNLEQLKGNKNIDLAFADNNGARVYFEVAITAALAKAWNKETSPLEAIQLYAKEGVTKEDIEKVLEENQITTLEGILDAFASTVGSLISEHLFQRSFMASVFNALKRERMSAETALGGKVLYDDMLIPKKCYELYAAGAVSVRPAEVAKFKKDEQAQAFTLVMGPSGSGKTLFALRGLPTMLFEGNESTYVRVHFQADVAIGQMTSAKPDFPQAVASVVQKKIDQLLVEERVANVTNVNLLLHVVIDEAGGDYCKEYFETTQAILDIVDALKGPSLLSYKFTQGVHLTIVGTGLDKITIQVKSVVDAIKFHMQRWTVANFDALLEKSEHPEPLLVKDTVKSFPILEDLLTNARCAYFLLMYMDNDFLLCRNHVREYVKVLISLVASSYVNSNALKMLTTMKDKWKVAQAVFVALDEATSRPGEAHFPTFDNLAKFRPIAISLLDVHVETTTKGLVIEPEGNDYALSMSPALTIVLVCLINGKAGISWDWEGFESTVMLSELKLMVVNATNDIPNQLDRLVLTLQSPVPASWATKTFSIPEVSKYTIVLNGPKAEYADVIAPYRLVQAKFSKDSAPSKLDLQEELHKMGVTTSSKHKLQQCMTALFYTMWETNAVLPTGETSETIQPQTKKYRFECYPLNTLNSRVVHDNPKMIEGCEDNDNWTVPSLGKDVITVVDANRPITVVFATNSDAFNVECFGSIDHNDVDWEGNLTGKELPKSIRESLQEHVNVRFLFF